MNPMLRPRTNRPFKVPIWKFKKAVSTEVKHAQIIAPYLDIFIRFLRSESATVTEQVDETHSNASIDIEDKCILLRRGDFLDSEGIVE